MPKQMRACKHVCDSLRLCQRSNVCHQATRLALGRKALVYMHNALTVGMHADV